MLNRNLPQYKNLLQYIQNCFSSGLNGLILTLPGLGLSHLLTQILTQIACTYINEPGQSLSAFNLLDLDANKRSDFGEIIDAYFRQKNQLQLKPVFITVINTPSSLNRSPLSDSFFINHSYRQHFFGTRTREELDDFLVENKFTQLNNQFDLIYQLSSGIPRLAKFLASHPDLLSEKPEKIAQNPALFPLIKPTLAEISNLPVSSLADYQLDPSPLLTALLDRLPHPTAPDLQVTPNLSLLENSLPNPNSFTATEIKILKFLSTHPLASRDDLAALKWKQAAFDQYSDQAINTTITRINHKLIHHHIKSRPKLGYSLLPKADSTKPKAVTTKTGL